MAKPNGVEEVVEEAPETEVEDGTENEIVKEAPEDGLVEEGVKDIDDEGEAGEAEEGADDPGESVEEEPAYVKSLRAELAEIKNQFKPEREEPKWKEPSEEEKAAMQEKYGMPYSGIQLMNSQMATLGTNLKSYIDNLFGQLTVNETIQDFSSKKGFEDAGKYKGDIRTFLMKVDPSARNNPDILETAYFYAKGKSSGKTVKAALASREQNRRVISSTKTPVQGDRSKKSRPLGKLDQTQRSVAKSFGMSEEDYAKLQTKYSK